LHRSGKRPWDTVVICEGEKDCEAVMALSLWTVDGGELIATTSGGANSWQDQFADELCGKRIVVMPDNDEAGALYADHIIASLLRRGIEHRVVSFGDGGAKDVSQFLEDGGSRDQLMTRMGADWVAESDPTTVERPSVFERA
jgi:DNA primase